MTNFATLDEVTSRSRSDIKTLLPDFDPTIFSSFIRVLVDSNSNRHYDNILTMQQLLVEMIPSSNTSLEWLIPWAKYEGITPFSPRESTGKVVFPGSVGAVIPSGSILKTEDGKQYSVDSESSVAVVSSSVLSLTRVGSNVTAIASSPHGLSSGLNVLISGADQVEYNGLFNISVISDIEFSYSITGSPVTPATGSIIFSGDFATVDVTSVESGNDKNLKSGSSISTLDIINGIDSKGYVQFAGIIGGQDAETSDDLWVRILQSRANPVANFNISAIEKAARTIQGVTRVKVKRIYPNPGDVTILFTRDNDDNILPDPSKVLEVKNAIIPLTPAKSDDSDVFVQAPLSVPINFNFSVITPDDQDMRNAVENQIRAFFIDNVDFETDVSEEIYKNAIANTIDPVSGRTLSSFTLNSPSGNISVGALSLAIVNDVIF